MKANLNKRRKLIVLTGAICVAGLFSGCVTESLFKDDRYSERISSVLLSEDGKKLVVIGESHHYIFDAPYMLVKTFKADFHKSVTATIGEFRVDGSGNTSGKVNLILSIKAPELDKNAAIEAGYKKFVSHDKRYGCELELSLVGTRYKSNTIQPLLASQKLNKTYTISVVAEQSSGEKAAKALLTPVTVTVDGLLIIGAIPLVLLSFVTVGTFIAVECHGKPNCFK